MSDSASTDRLVSSPAAEYDLLRYVSQDSPCPYLPGKTSRSEAFLVGRLDGEAYTSLLSQGFRRSGRVVYRPRCRSCKECQQLRVPVTEFAPSRSMRRVWRTNADVRVEVGTPAPSYEKYLLFRRYLEARHDDAMTRDYDTFVEFLHDSPMETCEFKYYVNNALIGVSLLDRCSDGLSSVYMYYDPRHANRSPGTYSILWEIEYCRLSGLPYYYLGFYVAGSRTMEYKARFRPNEVLVGAGRWKTLRQ